MQIGLASRNYQTSVGGVLHLAISGGQYTLRRCMDGQLRLDFRFVLTSASCPMECGLGSQSHRHTNSICTGGAALPRQRASMHVCRADIGSRLVTNCVSSTCQPHINCISTVCQLHISSVYKVRSNCVSAAYQLQINCVSTLYQLYFYCVCTAYQPHIDCVSTASQLRISC